MGGYKVRLDDGSEIGPLDLASVRSWYNDGLINPESMVLAPGSRRWAHLRQAIDIRAWGGATLRAGTRKRAAPAVRESVGYTSRERGDGRVQRLRAPLAGVLFIVGAALAGFWVFWPEQQRAALHGWPWPQIGLGLLALGLSLFVRPHITRRLVFGVLLLSGIAALAMIGVLVVEKAPPIAYIVLGGGILACFGFVALLEGPSGSWLRTVLGSLAVIAGYGTALHVGRVAPDQTESLLNSWVLPQAELSDTRVGMKLRLPAGWRLVKAGAPFLAAPDDAVGRIARLDASAFAYLTAERVPPDVVQLEPLCERAVAARRVVVPSLRAVERGTLVIGGQPAIRAVGESGAFASPTNQVVTVWRDGFTLYTLVGWAEGESRADAARRFDELASGFESLGGSGTRLADAIGKAVAEVPFISAATAERLMGASDAGVLDSSQLFKRALVLAGKGIPKLAPSDVRDLKNILDVTYRGMDRRDQRRLADYLGLIRSTGTSDIAQDREMCAVMARAVMQLSSASRQRLQALYDQTILTALADSRTGSAP